MSKERKEKKKQKKKKGNQKQEEIDEHEVEIAKKETIYYTLKKSGSIKILCYLYEVWVRSLNAGKKPPATRAKALSKCSGLSTRPINTVLRLLQLFKLINETNARYTISDLGLYVYSLLKVTQKISPVDNMPFTFNEADNPQDYVKWVISLIAGANEEILITTRWLGNFQKPEYLEICKAAFLNAKERGVKVRMITDKEFPMKIYNLFKDFDAKVRHIPCKKLENPPRVLKPIFLRDFSHVMIADRTHWLYIFPHDRNALHSGKGTNGDPIIAGHLAEIFDSFWALATPFSKSDR